MSIETNCVTDYILNKKGAKAVREWKESFSEAQQLILGHLKPSRNTSLVKTKLEEALMFGTREIASREENHESINTC